MDKLAAESVQIMDDNSSDGAVAYQRPELVELWTLQASTRVIILEDVSIRDRVAGLSRKFLAGRNLRGQGEATVGLVTG